MVGTPNTRDKTEDITQTSSRDIHLSASSENVLNEVIKDNNLCS